MPKEVCWLYAPSVVLVLKCLALKPRIPMQVKEETGIPWNYVNIILKKLKLIRIIICLTPDERIGKVFCINLETKRIVEKVLRRAGYNIEICDLPKLNWKAYGRLCCGTCSQIKLIFMKGISLRSRGVAITENNLEKELRNSDGVLTIDRSDIYRALRQIRNLGLMNPLKKKHSPLEYIPTDDALILPQFINSH